MTGLKAHKPVGIIGAMEVEVEELIAHISCPKRLEKAGSVYVSGELCGHDVVVVQCGIGKVSAAMAAQIMVDEFCVKALINTGVAGSLDPVLSVMDFVVSTGAIQHDMDATELGYEPGQIPGIQHTVFSADAQLGELAKRAIHEVAPDSQVLTGIVASGDQFVSDRAEKERLHESFDALCCEMEGAAIAQVAWKNEIPFVVVRAISDDLEGDIIMTFEEFEEKASRLSALVTEHMLALL